MIVEVNKIVKKFAPIVAVDQVTFRVRPGEVLGFLGPNGAGKSTTIKMIAGYLQADSGSILIDGKNIKEYPIECRKKIGYMPESNPLYKEMTVREFLKFVAEVHELQNLEARVSEVIELTNLKEVESQLIDTISKGYKSRLSFASAIIHDPPILLLDEPTDGLDPNQKNEIRSLIRSLSKEKSIIVSTHILEEVEAMCTRIIIISEGKLILDGTPTDLRAKAEREGDIIVSLMPKDREKVETMLSANLEPLGGTKDSFQRYKFNSDQKLSTINGRLRSSDVDFEELYHFDAPLDEAFRKITKTRD